MTMSLSLDDQANDIWMSISEAYARVGGRFRDSGPSGPRFVEFGGHWPLVSGRLIKSRTARPLSAMQIRNSSWHAHVPKGRLGIPSAFRINADASRKCVRCEGDAFYFDFTGMTPLPSNDLERRLLVLLDEIENFQRYHPEVLDRLGITIQVLLRED
jgi:hypothetical protein